MLEYMKKKNQFIADPKVNQKEKKVSKVKSNSLKTSPEYFWIIVLNYCTRWYDSLRQKLVSAAA